MHIRKIIYNSEISKYETITKMYNTIHYLDRKIINFIKDLPENSNYFRNYPILGYDKKERYNFILNFIVAMEEEKVKDPTVYSYQIDTSQMTFSILENGLRYPNMKPLISLYQYSDYINIEKFVGQILGIPEPKPGSRLTPLPKLSSSQKTEILSLINKKLLSWNALENEKVVFFIKHSEFLLNLIDKRELKKILERLFIYPKKQLFLDCMQLAQDGKNKFKKYNENKANRKFYRKG